MYRITVLAGGNEKKLDIIQLRHLLFNFYDQRVNIDLQPLEKH